MNWQVFFGLGFIVVALVVFELFLHYRRRITSIKKEEKWFIMPVFFTFKGRPWQALVRVSTQGKYGAMHSPHLRICIPNDGTTCYQGLGIPMLGAPKYKTFNHEDTEIMIHGSVYTFSEKEAYQTVLLLSDISESEECDISKV